MTAQPGDDWQQNADVALIQLQRLECSEQPNIWNFKIRSPNS